MFRMGVYFLLPTTKPCYQHPQFESGYTLYSNRYNQTVLFFNNPTIDYSLNNPTIECFAGILLFIIFQ